MFFKHALVWRTISSALLLAIILAYDSQKVSIDKTIQKNTFQNIIVLNILFVSLRIVFCALYLNIIEIYFSFLYIFTGFFSGINVIMFTNKRLITVNCR